MGIRRPCQRWLALIISLFFAATAAPAASASAEVLGDRPLSQSIAKKKKKKKNKRRKKRKPKAAAVEKAAEPAPAPPPPPTNAPAPPATPVSPTPGNAVRPSPSGPITIAPALAPTASPAAGIAPTPAAAPATPQVFEPNADPLWGGFFLSLNVGYASSGGTAGPVIPQPTGGGLVGFIIGGSSWSQWQQKNCIGPGAVARCYDKAVTTDVGSGVAAAFQVGYNVAGYASFWADFSWHGSFGSKTDTAGAGTVAVMLGLHPLRFWRPDAPVDVTLYAGYGFFEILYYYETQLDPQMEAKGKSWLGTAIPFGLSFEYRIPGSVFALGADLRFVAASYDEWVYNYDNDQKSAMSPAITTLRFEPRLVMGWHF